MANLKVGTLIGGNMIWHAGNMPLSVSDNDLYLKTYKVYTEANKPTPADVNALPISGGTLTGPVTYGRFRLEQSNLEFVDSSSSSASGILVKGVSRDSPIVGFGSHWNGATKSILNAFVVGTGDSWWNGQLLLLNKDGLLSTKDQGVLYGTTRKPTPADVGAFPMTGGTLNGPIIAKSYAIAESPNGQNWVGMESPDVGAPYISSKINNVAKKVMEFNFDGSINLPTTLHAQSINTAVWGNVLNSIGGSIRSNDASIMSLDGKTYSFVTSPLDAHLCQNSFWDGSNWLKYDVNSPSGHLYISGGVLRFNSSDAGDGNPNQKANYVYHTGHRPTPAEIGAAAATEVYSKAHIDGKSWMRTADLRGAVRPPNVFAEQAISSWFNEAGNPTAGWYSGINVRGWSDTYASWQLLSGSDLPDNQAGDAYKTALWFRSGNGDTWGEFQKVYTTKHKPTPIEIGAIPTSTSNGTPVAAYYLKNVIGNTGTKIRLPFRTDSLKMVSFTVRVYQEYVPTDIQFSGYLFSSTNQWHAPKAIVIAGAKTTGFLVKMGRDADGYAYVWLEGDNYRGVAVLDVVGGYNEADWNTGWVISETNDAPNVAWEGNIYPPYSPSSKPTSEELNVIGMNKKNYLNNTDQFGVGFISARGTGRDWIATYHGSDVGTKVVIGSLGDLATIGAHSPNLNEWADLYINAQDGAVGVPKGTIIGNPYAKNTNDNAVYRVYHQGFKPSPAEIGAAPAGYGLGGYAGEVPGADLNTGLRNTCGFFNGSSLANAPLWPTASHTWNYIFNACHANLTGYNGMIAMDFGGAGLAFKTIEAGTDKGWKYVYHTGFKPTPAEIGAMQDGGLYGTVTLNNWVRTTGDTGIYFETHGGGWRMQDSTWLRSYQDKCIYTGNAGPDAIHTSGGVNAIGPGQFSDVMIRSDRRLKTNFVQLENALDKICKLTAYSYDKKKNLSATEYDKHEVGLIAQDVQSVLPEAVYEITDSAVESDEKILAISGSAVNALLVEAIKELNKRIEYLESKIKE